MVGKKTGGRQKGTPNKATAKRQAEIADSGLTPLDYMLNVMRDETADARRRDEMAKAAAPFVHPRLAPIAEAEPKNRPSSAVIILPASSRDILTTETTLDPSR